MTDDIVARLREFTGPQYPDDICGKAAMRTAADEIERLRDDNKHLERMWIDCINTCRTKSNRVVQLRAALREARENILLRHNARGSEAAGTDEEVVRFIDAALAGEKTDD
jgi:hypothetical protein